MVLASKLVLGSFSSMNVVWLCFYCRCTQCSANRRKMLHTVKESTSIWGPDVRTSA